jgi:hypothetical protein
MDSRFIVGVVSIALVGCVTPLMQNKPDRNFNATSLTVDLTSNGRKVLDSIPVESAMDRFEMIDPQGRLISYIAFTDTDTGGLVFVDQKLHGTLSHHDAQAFYSCRGYATVAPNYWAQEAADWVASLLANTKPATSVKLDFSGKSTTQSIKEVAESPFLKKLKSLFGLGSNPLGIVNSLSTARSDMEAGDQFDKTTKGLNLIKPGMDESRVAEVMKPENISFVSDGMVMAYPSHLVDFYVTEGIVKVIQQPSFYYLSRTNAALFYAPDIQWPLCTPSHWKEALPEPRLLARSGQSYPDPSR